MNEAYENILQRRSIRKYKNQEVPQELVEAVVKAGTYAPTAMGTQSPKIVVVRNKETIKFLSKINAEIWGRPQIDPFYGAPIVIIVLADMSYKNGFTDGVLVMGNLMNAAHALGLGTCYINRLVQTFERDDCKALLKEWGIEGEWTGVGA